MLSITVVTWIVNVSNDKCFKVGLCCRADPPAGRTGDGDWRWRISETMERGATTLQELDQWPWRELLNFTSGTSGMERAPLHFRNFRGETDTSMLEFLGRNLHLRGTFDENLVMPAVREIYFIFFPNRKEYDCNDRFLFDYEPNGSLFC